MIFLQKKITFAYTVTNCLKMVPWSIILQIILMKFIERTLTPILVFENQHNGLFAFFAHNIYELKFQQCNLKNYQLITPLLEALTSKIYVYITVDAKKIGGRNEG